VLLNVTASIHYQYTDAARGAVSRCATAMAVVRSLGEAAARERVGQRRVAELLGWRRACAADERHPRLAAAAAG